MVGKGARQGKGNLWLLVFSVGLAMCCSPSKKSTLDPVGRELFSVQNKRASRQFMTNLFLSLRTEWADSQQKGGLHNTVQHISITWYTASQPKQVWRQSPQAGESAVRSVPELRSGMMLSKIRKVSSYSESSSLPLRVQCCGISIIQLPETAKRRL